MFVNRGNAFKTNWNGLNVSVTSTLIPRVFWQTASIDVFLDRKCILQTGGQLKITGSHSAEFEYEGKMHQVKLSWGQGGLRSFPFDLAINGETVANARVFTGNWYLNFLPWIFFAALALAYRYR